MSARRIAVLEPTAHAGGAQISLLELIRRLHGDPQIIVILPEDGPLRERALAAGAEVRILPWPAVILRLGERSGLRTPSGLLRAAIASGSIPLLAYRLAALLDDVRADALITNGIKPHIVGALAQFGSPRPLLWYLRDGFEGRGVSTRAMRSLARRCAGAIAISHYVAKEASEVLPASLPISVIYNIVDFARFHRDATPARDLMKQPGELWFGVVGALTALKGQDLFLRAAARVAPHLPHARFVIVGSNFYKTEAASGFEDELRRLADEPPLAGRVMFLGHRDDVAAVLRHIDILVQPNRGPEALGRSVLEAMACSIPVIVANKWGPAEVVTDGQTGVLTPVLDVPALATKMLDLARDPARRVALGTAAARWVREALEPDRIVAEFRAFVARFV